MIKKFFALTLAMLFVLNASAFAQTKKPISPKTTVQKNQLVSLLPASDGAMFIDVQRLLNESLPQILASNPPKLTEINEQIEAMQAQTGFDLRQFDQIAVGVTLTTTATLKNTVAPVVLARGKASSSALLMLAKAASKGKYREEKIGSKAVYIFAAKEILAENKPKATGNSILDKICDFLMKKMPAEIAVTTVDDKTLAIGALGRVREVFESKNKLGADIAALLNRKPNSLISFGANTPTGFSQFLDLDDDMLGQSLASIRQLYGAFNVNDGNLIGSLGAKSLNAEQAKSLEETLGGFQALGKSFLGSAKSEDKQVYARIIESAKITRAGLEVAIDFQIANADLALLLK